MKTVDVLIKAKEILSNPAHWTKGTLRKELGDGTTCFCSNGGLAQAVGLLQLVPSRPRRNFKEPDLDSLVAMAMKLSPLSGPGEAEYFKEQPLDPKYAAQVKVFRRAQEYLRASINKLHKSPAGGYVREVWGFNDGTSTMHDQVMEVFDHAIRCAKRRHIAKGKASR